MENNKLSKTLKEIEEESTEYAKEHYRITFRSFISILLVAILFAGFNPSNLPSYIASFIFMLIPILWSIEAPKNKKHRVFAYISCLILSTAIYLAYVI